MAERLPRTDYSPRASKAPAGAHDENIDFDAIVKLVGTRDAPRTSAALPSMSIDFAAEHARARNIIIADTKFEFGVDKAGRLLSHRRSP